jgi:hypothetical protein
VASESTSTWKHRNPTTDLVQRITTIAIAQSNIFSLLLSPGPWEDDLHIQIVPGFRGKKVSAPDGLVPDHQNEAGLFTNASRERFGSDYIYFLTDRSIRSGFNAFAKGFSTCLD